MALPFKGILAVGHNGAVGRRQEHRCARRDGNGSVEVVDNLIDHTIAVQAAGNQVAVFIIGPGLDLIPAAVAVIVMAPGDDPAVIIINTGCGPFVNTVCLVVVAVNGTVTGS